MIKKIIKQIKNNFIEWGYDFLSWLKSYNKKPTVYVNAKYIEGGNNEVPVFQLNGRVNLHIVADTVKCNAEVFKD